MALVPQVVDAVGEQVPGRRRRRAVRRARPGRVARPRRRRRVDRHPLHRHARGPGGRRATRRRCWPPPRTAPSSAAPTPARPAGSCATSGRTTSTSHPEELQAVPRSRRSPRPRRASTTSAAPDGTEVDVRAGVHAVRPGRRRHRLAGAGRRPGAADGRRGRARPSTAARGRAADDGPPLDRSSATSTAVWTDDIVPALHDYIAHPQRVAGVRPGVGEHGHMARAVELIARLVPRRADRRPHRRGARAARAHAA